MHSQTTGVGDIRRWTVVRCFNTTLFRFRESFSSNSSEIFTVGTSGLIIQTSGYPRLSMARFPTQISARRSSPGVFLIRFRALSEMSWISRAQLFSTYQSPRFVGWLDIGMLHVRFMSPSFQARILYLGVTYYPVLRSDLSLI